MISFETPFTAESVGYDEDRLGMLNKHFESMIAQKKIISANYCLASDGKIFANTALGKLSYREDDPRELSPDTIIKIASITKLFTSVAIWQLAEDGKLRVNQRVGEILEEFREKPFDEITIAHLLSHTSGLQPDGNCFQNKYFISQWELMNHDNGKNWIAAALGSGLRKKPGEEWAYCSFGFVILGEVITRVSGQFANDYIMEHIVKQCELEDTSFDLRSNKFIQRTNIPSERREKYLNDLLQGKANEVSFWDKVPSTGGGLVSTALDLCKFGIMLQQGGYVNGKRIIGRKAIEKMTAVYTEPQIKDYCWGAEGCYRRYGLGPDLRCNEASLYSEGTFFHEGAGACSLIIDPVEKLVAAWFVPFVNEVWCPEPLYNAAAVMWSGLK